MEPTEELLERAQRGDHDAFRALMQPALLKGYRLAFGVLGDRQAAEDATQDAVLTAWRKLDNVRPGHPVEPWFLAIVVNRCRRIWRQRQRSFVAPRAAPGPNVAEGVADRVDVSAALVRLSAQQRVLVVLRYYFDLPLADAARIAGVPLGTAKSRLHRALATLRVDLTGEETSHGRNRTS